MGEYRPLTRGDGHRGRVILRNTSFLGNYRGNGSAFLSTLAHSNREKPQGLVALLSPSLFAWEQYGMKDGHSVRGAGIGER
nr:hypothetical protein [Desulfobacterales bacterium]